MKKQILAAAVAAVIATPAMADISITGNAKFEYIAKDSTIGGADKGDNTTETEINLKFKGTSGDTSVYANIEIDGATGTKDKDGNAVENVIDVEDTYLTTKIGPVNVKAGNFASSTSALLGEIDNGGRVADKFTLSYAMDGIKVYAGNNGTAGDDTPINNNMFAGVVATVAGWKLELKKNNEDKNSFGVNGKLGPVGIRAEYFQDDAVSTAKGGTAANNFENKGYFLSLTADLSNVSLALATMSLDEDGYIDEDDSSAFVKTNNDNAFKEKFGNSNTQLSASMKLDGTTYAAALGTMSADAANTKDIDYYQVSAKRMLDSGSTLKVAYTTEEQGNDDNNELELDISVKF